MAVLAALECPDDAGTGTVWNAKTATSMKAVSMMDPFVRYQGEQGLRGLLPSCRLAEDERKITVPAKGSPPAISRLQLGSHTQPNLTNAGRLPNPR